MVLLFRPLTVLAVVLSFLAVAVLLVLEVNLEEVLYCTCYLKAEKRDSCESPFLFLLCKYHQRQVALATADDMQRLIHRNLVLLVSAHQAHMIHSQEAVGMPANQLTVAPEKWT